MRVIIVKIVISELEGITSPTKAEISGIEASIIHYHCSNNEADHHHDTGITRTNDESCISRVHKQLLID